ncbi:MAG: flavodoxin family protein [Clostridiaceae bacterium]
MKVLIVNGSGRPKGCTYVALSEMEQILNGEGIETEQIFIGNEPLRDCTECMKCKQLDNRCVFEDDIVNDFIDKAKTADGFIYGSPVYFASPSARIQALLDRSYYAAKNVFRHKPACAIVSARRAGTTAALEVLNKYITYTESPLVASSYWPMVHGRQPEDVLQDEEGMQTIRNLARNMAWILHCIEAGKAAGYSAPTNEYSKITNFI